MKTTCSSSRRAAPRRHLGSFGLLAAIFLTAIGPLGLTSASGAPAGRALASADFDEDGTADLVSGYSDEHGGRVVVQRGNVDAIYPNSPEARARKTRGEFSSAPFYPHNGALELPAAADFVGTGDFDADGHWDIATAARGGTKVFWLRGDGRGNFESAQPIELDGAVTAMKCGEVNRRDGLHDLVVAVARADGARAMIFEGAEGALRRAPESLLLAAPVTDIALGDVNNDWSIDIAFAAGAEVVVVNGRDRMLSLTAERQAEVPAAGMHRVAYGSAVQAVAMGDFIGDSQPELAALTADGQVHVASDAVRVASDSRPYSGAATALAVETGRKRLVTAKVSASQKNDLLVFGSGTEVQVVSAVAANRATQSTAMELRVTRSVSSTSGEVTAALPMRLNADALSDLVSLSADGGAAHVIQSHGGGVYVVNATGNTNDKTPGNGVCEDDAGDCTFSAAIQESNAHPGADTINFNLPGAGPHVISPNFGQSLDETVTIDGTTQPAGRVEIVANGYFPLVFYGANSVLRGVATYGSSTAIFLLSDGNIVEGNYIGFRADGTKPVGYGTSGSGIAFRGGVNGSRFGNNNLIGGTVAQARNVISNCDTGLNLSFNTGNVFQGNYIGTTVDGTAALPNRYAFFSDQTELTIGGTTAGAGNVISATTQVVLGMSKSGLVQGNRFGTTADGTQPLPNGGIAIDIGTNEPLTIGGTTPAARNVISANSTGIRIGHDSGGGALIQGNYIGTNATGTGALPNSEVGLQLGGTRGAVIGGTAPGAGNLISGNAKNGVELNGGINATPCRNVVIQGNLIGTDANGMVALPNGGHGVVLEQVHTVLLGGTTPEARNIISGNRTCGVSMTVHIGLNGEGPALVQGNYIGLNISGTGALANGSHGVQLFGGSGQNIGGTEPGAGNRIAFNSGDGISSNGSLGGAILSNSIFGNRGLGIDSGNNDVDQRGPNDYQRFPTITSVATSGGETTISGTLRTRSDGGNASFRIQFFASTGVDPTGYGEGQEFIGETNVTGPVGDWTPTMPFSVTLPADPAGPLHQRRRHWQSERGRSQFSCQFRVFLRCPRAR